MRELWQRSPEILRKHLALWLPITAAALLSSLTSKLMFWVMEKELRSLWRHPSMLDSKAYATTGSVAGLSIISVIVILFGLGLILYTSYLQVPAFLATAQMSAAMEQQPAIGPAEALQNIHVDQVQAFWFGAQVTAARLAFELVTAGPISIYFRHHSQLAASSFVPYANNIANSLFLVALAYWMTPSALTLLHPLDAQPVQPERLRRARLFAMGCVAISRLIGMLIFAAPQHIRSATFPNVMVGAVLAMLGGLPYVVMAAVFGFVARGMTADVPSAALPTYNL